MAASLVGAGLLAGAAWAQSPYAGYTNYGSQPASSFSLPPVGLAPDASRSAANLTPPGVGMPSMVPAAPAPSGWNTTSAPASQPRPSQTSMSQGMSGVAQAPATYVTSASPQILVFEKQPNPPAPTLQRAGFQPSTNAPGSPAGRGPTGIASDEAPGYQIPLTPPGPGRLFTLDSEAGLIQRIIQENHGRTPPENAPFPEEPILSRETYQGRRWPEMHETVEPRYVCYGRLFYEDKNSERYGWEMGIAQPFVSALSFYAHLATVPYQWGSDPCRCTECNAGYCLPGDPVPYLLYPPGLSLTGLAAEGAAATGIALAFP